MMTSGVVGGVFAASASHPFDTVKTRMQVGARGDVEVMRKAQAQLRGHGWLGKARRHPNKAPIVCAPIPPSPPGLHVQQA